MWLGCLAISDDIHLIWETANLLFYLFIQTVYIMDGYYRLSIYLLFIYLFEVITSLINEGILLTRHYFPL